MASVPSWQSDPSSWDRLKLGNDWLPGPVVVKIPKIDSGLDVRKAPKSSRAALVDQGYNPVKATIVMKIGFEPEVNSSWPSAEEQVTLWCEISDRIRPKRAQKRSALQVSHPQFQLAGVSQVYVLSVSGLEGEGPGLRTVTISVVERAPVIQAPSGTVGYAKPKGSVSLTTLVNASDPSVSEAGP